jgi:hypothetical protein
MAMNGRLMQGDAEKHLFYRAVVIYCDAVMLLAHTMERTDMSDPKALKSYIVNDSSWRGVLGNYKLDRYGDSHRRFYCYTILRGHFMRVD